MTAAWATPVIPVATYLGVIQLAGPGSRVAGHDGCIAMLESYDGAQIGYCVVGAGVTPTDLRRMTQFDVRRSTVGGPFGD